MTQRKKGCRKFFDRSKVERAIKLLLEGVGEDADREGLRETPRRVCDYYEEMLSGMWQDPRISLQPIEGDGTQDLVVIRDISFVSICEHHLLPFIGKVSVAYEPSDKRILGISKIVRALDVLSHRLQIQERLTGELAEAIAHQMKPQGLLVVVEAEHLCMTVRGVKKKGSTIVTKRALGSLKDPYRQALAISSMTK